MKKVTPGKQAIVAKVNGKKRVRDLPFQTESKRWAKKIVVDSQIAYTQRLRDEEATTNKQANCSKSIALLMADQEISCSIRHDGYCSLSKLKFRGNQTMVALTHLCLLRTYKHKQIKKQTTTLLLQLISMSRAELQALQYSEKLLSLQDCTPQHF